ncbi:MAG: HEAT repeat domain-containing protein [Desulfobacterales bacterium]|nr:HEAT repeat domain-containing protein [Desulfobacterales bacterium]
MKAELGATESAKKFLHGLIGAFKKLILYSETHTVYYSALGTLKKLFGEHFDRFGNLRIHIERKKIRYQDEVLYEGGMEPTDLALLLHRDGILWLEFQNRLEIWEIDAFCKILRDHCTVDEDPEDDIVTALWAVNLPSILYEAADLELGLPDDINFADLPCAGNQAVDSEQKDEPPFQCETIYSALANNVLTRAGQDELWELTAAERDQLRKMIASEEQLDGSDYAIDVLLYILENECLQEDIAELLDTLWKELNTALIHARFPYLFEAVTRLKNHIRTNNASMQWSVPHIQTFVAKLAMDPYLSGLQRVAASHPTLDAQQLKALKRFLLLLDKSAISTLGPMVMNIASPGLQRVLLETIGTMAMSDFGPLERLIEHADPELARRLVYILGFLKDSRSRQTLSTLMHHPAGMVRLASVKALLTRDDQAIEEIFALIDDSNETIRKLVLGRLGRDRCEQIENKLLTYLNSYGNGSKNGEHFIEACRALGKCGSDRSIPYLTGMLFKWPTLGFLRPGNGCQRRGAVVALETLKTEKAARLIDRANRGFLANLFRSALFQSA